MIKNQTPGNSKVGVFYHFSFRIFLAIQVIFASIAFAKSEYQIFQDELYKYALDFASPNQEITDEPEEIWDRIEGQEFPTVLEPFYSKFKNTKSYVVLFNKLAFFPMDMRSGDLFKKSMISGFLKKDFSIGHMSVGWSCSDGNQRHEGLTAQSGEHLGQSTYLLEQGWGLTALLSTYTDGNMHSPIDIQRYFSRSALESIEVRKKPPLFTAFVLEVPASECEAVRGFVRDYIHSPKLPWKNFSMIANPLKFEGGGCGSFAVSALSKAKTLESVMNASSRVVSLPKSLLGAKVEENMSDLTNPYVPPAENKLKEKSVSSTKLLISNWDSKRNSFNIDFVDPELINLFFKIIAQESKKNIEDVKNRNLFYSELEALNRTFNFGTSPGEHDFSNDSQYRGLVTIDRKFDSYTETMYQATENLIGQLQRSGKKVVPVQFPMGLGVLIEEAN